MKILIFNPFGIGDVLFTTPLIRNIKNKLPSAEIFYLANARTYNLLKANKFIEEVFVFEKDEWRNLWKKSKFTFVKNIFSFFKKLRKLRFDILFDFSLNSQYGFFLKLLGIKKRIGLNFRNRGRFLTHKEELPYGFCEKHVADYYLSLLKFLGINVSRQFKFDVFLEEDIKETARNILKNLGIFSDHILIGICPGSGDSWGEASYYKRWPKEYFVELCDRLSQDSRVRIIIFGSKSEVSIADYIMSHTKSLPINLCGKTSLLELCALLSMCKVFITNDGGPFHVAQGLGIKTVGIFGPVDDKVYGKYPSDNPSVVIVKKDLRCRPCYREFKFHGCMYDKLCLRKITVEEVLEKVKELLESELKKS